MWMFCLANTIVTNKFVVDAILPHGGLQILGAVYHPYLFGPVSVLICWCLTTALFNVMALIFFPLLCSLSFLFCFGRCTYIAGACCCLMLCYLISIRLMSSFFVGSGIPELLPFLVWPGTLTSCVLYLPLLVCVLPYLTGLVCLAVRLFCPSCGIMNSPTSMGIWFV